MPSVTVELAKAIEANLPFPSSVPDTPENRSLFAKLAQEIDEIRSNGGVPDVPWDYNE